MSGSLKLVLGIESSCDETAVALVRSDGTVLSDSVSSQVALHAPYGGVVPELAARAHMQNIVPVFESALASIDLSQVDGIAVTQGPGLIGALLIGVQAGKAIAMARRLPIVGVNHLIGHLLAVFLQREGAPSEVPTYPFIALLVSGGHTALYEVRSPFDIEQLGQTRDDAAGEAFDKVAKLLGLGYPGGPRVDKLALQGDEKRVRLPRPMMKRDNLEFSFSGLKTAVAQRVLEHGALDDQAIADVCAAFQANVVSVLVKKSLAACAQRGVPRLVLTGGVAANRGLRAFAKEACAREDVALFVPPFASCTDNAAMIAYAGAKRLLRGDDDGLGLSVFSRSPILGLREGSPAAQRYKSSRLPR
ncbi:MAG TPA: tRNA (adenosine(37)-N6)-threonylcarbamoyltransferase complex transferase subunit TsaD [Polyangiales bacterium]|nr:tRNA (adenosine(37)-N6)-threonylcarbamoyltransferase complex transferase subunit TsaD [Polyangiales bacterium]